MKKLFLLLCIGAAFLSASDGLAAYINWTNWTSANTGPAGSVTGTISLNNGTIIEVRYSGDVTFAQLGSGTNYWIEKTPPPYTGNTIVDNSPTASEVIALSRSSITNTLTFTPAVTDPIIAIVSLGRPTIEVSYSFNTSFTLLSEGEGYWGKDADGVQIEGNTLKGEEFHGVIQFIGTISSISWVSSPVEYWHGFTVGVAKTAPPVAICQDVIVSTDPNTCSAKASVDGGSFDPDGGEITLEQTPPGPYDLGDTDVTLTVTDDSGASGTCDATVTVIDEEDPIIFSVTASPNKLWPPNHKMVPVTVAVNAMDNCDSACQILSVQSNETFNGIGDGNTAPDWLVTSALTVYLRAERSGGSTSRIYTITVDCADNIGNSATETVEVTVPHDKGKKNNKK